MNRNVGTIDSALRSAIGLVLLALLFFGESPVRWIGLLGFVSVATGIFRFCPLYTVLGIDTCSLKK